MLSDRASSCTGPARTGAHRYALAREALGARYRVGLPQLGVGLRGLGVRTGREGIDPYRRHLPAHPFAMIASARACAIARVIRVD